MLTTLINLSCHLESFKANSKKSMLQNRQACPSAKVRSCIPIKRTVELLHKCQTFRFNKLFSPQKLNSKEVLEANMISPIRLKT